MEMSHFKNNYLYFHYSGSMPKVAGKSLDKDGKKWDPSGCFMKKDWVVKEMIAWRGLGRKVEIFYFKSNSASYFGWMNGQNHSQMAMLFLLKAATLDIDWYYDWASIFFSSNEILPPRRWLQLHDACLSSQFGASFFHREYPVN